MTEHYSQTGHGRPERMMTFSDSVKSCLSNYMNWSGRASRSEYFWFWLFNLVSITTAIVIDAVIVFLTGSFLYLSVLLDRNFPLYSRDSGAGQEVPGLWLLLVLGLSLPNQLRYSTIHAWQFWGEYVWRAPDQYRSGHQYQGHPRLDARQFTDGGEEFLEGP